MRGEGEGEASSRPTSPSGCGSGVLAGRTRPAASSACMMRDHWTFLSSSRTLASSSRGSWPTSTRARQPGRSRPQVGAKASILSAASRRSRSLLSAMQLSVAFTLFTQSPRRVFQDFFTAVHGIFSSRSVGVQRNTISWVTRRRQGVAEGRGAGRLLLRRRRLRACQPLARLIGSDLGGHRLAHGTGARPRKDQRVWGVIDR